MCICVIHRFDRKTGNILFAIITGPIAYLCRYSNLYPSEMIAKRSMLPLKTRKKFRGRNNFFSPARTRVTVPGTGSKPTALKIRTSPVDIIYAEDITRSCTRAEIIPGAELFAGEQRHAGPGPLEYLVVVKRFRS